MSDKIKLLLRGGQPHRVIDSETTLKDVTDYYEEQYGEQARFMDFSTKEIPAHPEL